MPLYQVEIPGRGKFKVESPTELTDEQVYAAVLQDIGNAPPPKKGLMAALGKGAESTLSGLRTGVGKYINPEEAAMAGLQRGEEISGKYADQTGLDKVKEAYTKDGVLSAAKEVGRQIPLVSATGIGASSLVNKSRVWPRCAWLMPFSSRTERFWPKLSIKSARSLFNSSSLSASFDSAPLPNEPNCPASASFFCAFLILVSMLATLLKLESWKPSMIRLSPNLKH